MPSAGPASWVEPDYAGDTQTASYRTSIAPSPACILHMLSLALAITTLRLISESCICPYSSFVQQASYGSNGQLEQQICCLQVAAGGPHLGNQANLNHLGNPNHRAIPGMGAMGHVPGGLVGGGLGGLAAGELVNPQADLQTSSMPHTKSPAFQALGGCLDDEDQQRNCFCCQHERG